MKIEATIYRIMDKVQVSENFSKREFIAEYIEDKPEYSDLLKFELANERCSQLDNLKVGDKVDINFNLRGRKWVNKENKEVFFNSLQAWKVTENVTKQPTQPDAFQPTKEKSDELPF